MVNRSEQINALNDFFNQEDSGICLLYGRRGQGKTTLIKSYLENKQSLWFDAMPGSKNEIKHSFIQAVCFARGEKVMQSASVSESFEELVLRSISGLSGTITLVIENFENMVKASKEFFTDCVKLLKNSNLPVRLYILLTSSSVYFVENGLISAVGAAAMYINSFIKIKELSFVDTVRMFPDYNVEDIIKLYAVTGGVPSYLAAFSPKKSLKENIVEQVISSKGTLFMEGHDFVKNELRETGVYNTILSAIAGGREKLNDIYEYTGFGRDKISVYIKNLMEREIVEKVFSYDSKGYANTRKGLYRICDKHVCFWYRYLFPNITALNQMRPDDFYNLYIADTIKEYASYTFTMVAHEYLELMDKTNSLPIKLVKCSSWYGKKGNIDIVCEGQNKEILVGVTNSTNRRLGLEDFELLKENTVLAGVESNYYYLFSLGGFTDEIRALSKSDNIVLVGLEDL